MLYWETVSPELKKLLERVSNNSNFDSFRLCGGTALALQLNHRLSIDADYVAEKQFDKDELAAIITREIPEVKDLYVGEIGVFLKAQGIRLDFLSWNISFIQEAVLDEGIRLVSIEEIAAMKLFAITQRGQKKDYYDVAFLLKKYSLKQLLEFYQTRHPQNDASLVARFLVTFSDINFQPDPVILTDFTWENAKALLQDKVKDYLKEV